jgi:hypothetical protein
MKLSSLIKPSRRSVIKGAGALFLVPVFGGWSRGMYGNDEVGLFGDSNTFSGQLVDGSAGFNPAIDVTNPRCLEYRNAHPTLNLNYTQVALDRFMYDNSAPPQTTPNSIGAIGPGLTFMRDYYLPIRLSANRNVRITCSAVSGTGFTGGWWVPPSGGGVVDAVTRINRSIAQDARNTIVAILWTSGANDAIHAMSQADYTTNFVALASYFRANITGATNVPILVEPLVPAWVATDPTTFGPVAAALAAMPSNVSKCGYVDPAASGLSGNILGQTAIPYHLTAASDRLIGNPGFGNAWTNLSP